MTSSCKKGATYLLGVWLALTTMQVVAAEAINTLEKSGLFNFEPSGIAIRGADTVAYFTERTYLPGQPQYATQWRGATWQFASQQHLELFEANPEQYAPQYGGYCAYGVAQNYLVKIEPDNWSIIEGKLYLNFNGGVQSTWEANIPLYIKQANRHFPALVPN